MSLNYYYNKLLGDLLKKKIQWKYSVELLDKKSTLREIVNSNKSIARFGDGECSIMFSGGDTYHQKGGADLEEKLKLVLSEPNENLIISYNNTFMLSQYYRMVIPFERTKKEYESYETIKKHSDVGVLKRKREQQFYVSNFDTFRKFYKGKIVGDATVFFLTSFYEEYVKNEIIEILELYSKLFMDKSILFICPNNPFIAPSFKQLIEEDIIKSLRKYDFIEIPDHDAFEIFDQLYTDVTNVIDKYDAIIIQAGPTATILAHILSLRYKKTAYDVGSLNISLYKGWQETGFRF